MLDQPHLGGTVTVPIKSTVRFDDPGDRMFHCHLREHAERGMMGALQVGWP